VSRPQLEVRKRVAALPNVVISDCTVVTRFCTDWERARLTGVLIRGRGLHAVEERLPADLIVDASGRGSQTPRRLVEIGYIPPPESTVKLDLGKPPLNQAMGDAVQVNWRRHYESITRFPIGLMVLGDALCSLNSIYAQGMTVSALQAMLLETCLCELRARRMPNMDALTHNFRERVAQLVQAPWELSIIEDFRVARAVGKRSLKLRFMLWYAGKLHEAARLSPTISERLDQVWNLTMPRASLFSLKIVKELLRLNGRRDRAVAEIHAANENFPPPEEERPFVQSQPFAQERRYGC
jgi:2-polyprenyl-6-methoxyphenol hydroxylase-like FAD-dependent oxidoreductase